MKKIRNEEEEIFYSEKIEKKLNSKKDLEKELSKAKTIAELKVIIAQILEKI